MKERGGLAVPLEPLGGEAEAVIPLSVDHDERAAPPGDVEHFEDIAVGELHVVIRHEDLDRGIALGDQCRQPSTWGVGSVTIRCRAISV
jgi:hypothetical protein